MDLRAQFSALLLPTISGCQLWLGDTSRTGEPRFRIPAGNKGRSYYQPARELAWQWCYGWLPPELLIEMRCGEEMCVNPFHMQPAERRTALAAPRPYQGPEPFLSHYTLPETPLARLVANTLARAGT